LRFWARENTVWGNARPTRRGSAGDKTVPLPNRKGFERVFNELDNQTPDWPAGGTATFFFKHQA